MNMHRTLLSATAALTLAGCTSFQTNAQETARYADQQMQQTGVKVKEMFTYYPPNKKKKPVPERYCYQVLQDVMCYDRPMAGMQDRLIAYQGNVSVPEPVVPVGVWDKEKDTRPGMLQSNRAPDVPGTIMPPNQVEDYEAAHPPVPDSMQNDSMRNAPPTPDQGADSHDSMNLDVNAIPMAAKPAPAPQVDIAPPAGQKDGLAPLRPVKVGAAPAVAGNP